MNTSRRQFMIVTLSGLGAALLAAAGCGEDAGPEPLPQEDPFVPDVPPEEMPDTKLEIAAVAAAWFAGADPAAIRAIGRARLQSFSPDEAAVVADLSAVVEIFADIDDLTAALEAIDAAVIDNLSAVSLASVEGWQLALTEARMCALADRFPA